LGSNTGSFLKFITQISIMIIIPLGPKANCTLVLNYENTYKLWLLLLCVGIPNPNPNPNVACIKLLTKDQRSTTS